MNTQSPDLSESHKATLNYGLEILTGSRKHTFQDSFRREESPRCIEVPWVAAQIVEQDCRSLLDIGFSLASPDYLGVLLNAAHLPGITLEAADIVEPASVASRYPADWLEDIFSVPFFHGDIRQISLPNKRYDTITCISVIEHIGYDRPSENDPESAFARERSKERVNRNRPSDTNNKVLDKLSVSLKDNGIVLISVPAGKGGPELLQDSLGYYCVQWEYDQESWLEIIHHPGYRLVEDYYFKLTSGCDWLQVGGIDKIAIPDPDTCISTKGCAMAVLQKIPS